MPLLHGYTLIHIKIYYFFLVEEAFSLRFLTCFLILDFRFSACSSLIAFLRSFRLLGDSPLGRCESWKDFLDLSS